jgi:hypothetical protein
MDGSAAGELVDAGSLAGDGAALRDLIARDGYVFLRGLLDAGVVRDIGRRGLSALQAAGWTAPGVDPVAAPPRLPVRAVRMRDAFGQAGYRQIVADPGFNQLPYVSPLADVMHRLMGPDAFCYPLKIPRVVYPASVVPRQPGNVAHMDYGSVQDMFTCWVPLGDVPRSLGGLAIEAGSQRSRRVRHRAVDSLPPGWRTTDFEAGDVLVFHCLTTHAALPNQSRRMRFSAEYRWQLADQPAPRRMVVGPAGNEIGSRLFGRTRWWRPVPAGVTLFDEGGRLGRARRPAPSRFVDLTG